MYIRFLPLVTGLLPMLAINLAFVLAVNDGDIVKCNPYWDGCASISATGRPEPSTFLFKAVMLPQSMILMAYWIGCYFWIRSLEQTRRPLTRWILVCGIISSLFLILYVTFLGSQGDFYQLMRRYGVTVYFSFTYLSQLFLVSRMYHLENTVPNLRLPLKRLKLGLCIGLLLLGLVSIPVGNLMENKDAWQNVIEWNFAVLMQLYFVCTYFAWKHTGFSLSFSSKIAVN